MGKLVFASLLLAAASLAQETGLAQENRSGAENSAVDALKQRLEKLKLVETNPNAPKPIRLTGMPPKVCAVPLVAVRPPGTLDPMRAANPQARASGPEANLPAPPCGEAAAK